MKINCQLVIKNIVCSRCIRVVQHIFEINQVKVIRVLLGIVEIEGKLTSIQVLNIKKALHEQGFEWVVDEKEQLVARIKALIIEQIHYQDEPLNMNYSDYLISKLNYSYAHLSRVFTNLEKQTIGAFIIAQRIEKVKELLIYEELSLSKIADLLHYSSTAQLSNQFKKVVGILASEFKRDNILDRKPLDKI